MSLYELERDGKAQELIRLLRESDNERVKTRAAELLGNFDDHDDRRDVVNALVDAAQSDSDAITGAAIDSLDELGDDAITQLIGSMAGVDLEDDAADWVKAKAYMQVLDADVPELRMAAANGLGNLDQADAVPKLAERFEDPDPRVRARAARSAGKIGDSRATTPLESVLSDPKAAVRREAADALGNIGNRQALQALLPLYEDDTERVPERGSEKDGEKSDGEFRHPRARAREPVVCEGTVVDVPGEECEEHEEDAGTDADVENLLGGTGECVPERLGQTARGGGEDAPREEESPREEEPPRRSESAVLRTPQEGPEGGWNTEARKVTFECHVCPVLSLSKMIYFKLYSSLRHTGVQIVGPDDDGCHRVPHGVWRHQRPRSTLSVRSLVERRHRRGHTRSPLSRRQQRARVAVHGRTG